MKLSALIVLWFPVLGWSEVFPPKIISLVPPGAYKVLEGENQMAELCVDMLPKQLEKCRQEKLKPKEWRLTLFEKPDFKSKKIGKIKIVAVPGKGLDATYSEDGKKFEKLESDSKNTDWGYGNFFEFTVRDLNENWIQLPKRPFTTPVWINLKKDWGATDLPQAQELSTDTIYTTDLGDIVILEFSKKTFSYRFENENDMPCGEEEAKQLSPDVLEVKKADTDELFDSDGHLTAWIKYPKGC